MSDEWLYREGDGGWASIAPAAGHPGSVMVKASVDGARVPASEFPAIIEALYSGAGLAGRLGTADRNAHVASWALWRDHGKVFLTEMGIDGSLDPSSARLLAAAIVMHANAAEAGPDPEEVRELARIIHADQCEMTVIPDPCDRCTAAARAALLAGYRREAKP